MEPSQMDPAAAMALGGGMLVAILLITSLLYIAIFWPIFKKTHGKGNLALLNLIPIVGALICIVMLAMGRWPNIDGGNS
jgi:nucleoside recognition membrane protein YjiH